jgi:glycine hydroxymethyltransferase
MIKKRVQHRFRRHGQPLILVDLRNKGVTGKDAENILSLENITCNKNAVPKIPKKTFGHKRHPARDADRNKPGMNEADMDTIAECIDLMIQNPAQTRTRSKKPRQRLTDQYPIDY